MKLKFLVVVAILGFLSITEGRFPKLKIDPSGGFDPETAAKLTSKVEEAINQKWKRHTIEEEADDTTFSAPILGSQIRGKKMITLGENRTIYAYQGFRFANSERFLPPTDLDNYWSTEIFNATHIGPKCPQGSNEGGDEDCLFLNVYTPYLPGTADAQNLTVMFFIHGGSFVGGSAASYLPTKLLNHDVILVTIHYRLGAFGFYTRNTAKAPGNMALYDMISALRWVQRNIKDFGGDPTKVTIFGESAGSVSVNYMMLVTKDYDYFRGVIAESGAALEHWALDEDPSYATWYYEGQCGCNTTEVEEEILDCMRNVPTQTLLEAQQSLISSDRKSGLPGFRGVSPTVQTFEKTDDVDFDIIVYQEPRDFFHNKDFKDVPFMTGSNREEGSLVVGIMILAYLIPNNLLNNKAYLREDMLRDLLLSVGVKDEPEGIAKTMQEKYCNGVDLGNLEEAQYCLIDISGILFLKAGSWQTVNYHSYYSETKNNTFYYSFEFESDDAAGEISVGNLSFYAGVAHADELKYLFSDFSIMDEDNGQVDVYQRMTLLWTNFARYLDPTPDDDTSWQDLDIPKWTPYRFEEPHYMLIDNDFSVHDDFQERWTATNDLFGPKPVTAATEEPDEPITVTEDPDICEGKCKEYEDQKNAYMITMIVFIVAFFIACLVATYFVFKLRS